MLCEKKTNPNTIRKMAERAVHMSLAPPMPDVIYSQSAKSILQSLPIAPGKKNKFGVSTCASKTYGEGTVVGTFSYRRRWLFLYWMFEWQFSSISPQAGDIFRDRLRPMFERVVSMRTKRQGSRKWWPAFIAEQHYEQMGEDLRAITPDRTSNDLIELLMDSPLLSWIFTGPQDCGFADCNPNQMFVHTTQSQTIHDLIHRGDAGMGLRRFALQFFGIPCFKKEFRTAAVLSLAEAAYKGDIASTMMLGDALEDAGMRDYDDPYQSIPFLKSAPELYRQGMTLVDLCLPYAFKP